MKMHHDTTKILLTTASALLFVTAGCATKKYVRNETTPMIQHTNELDDQTAANHRNIEDVDHRAGQGIQQAQAAAESADQKAISAGQSATQAQSSAQEALNHADSLASVVSNLDTYHQVASSDVHFGFDKAVLTRSDKADLDTLGAQLAGTKSYILEITGGTDSVGDKAYNYQLSERRAEAVAQYLAAKYSVPAHKFYLIGIGKDAEVASNRSASGRAKNRRVQIQLLSNTQQDATSAQAVPPNSNTGVSQPQQGTMNQSTNPAPQQ